MDAALPADVASAELASVAERVAAFVEVRAADSAAERAASMVAADFTVGAVASMVEAATGKLESP